jgi:hypothetical protein
MRLNKFVTAIAFATLGFMAGSAVAADPLVVDLTGTGVTSIASDKVRISGVSALGKNYDIDLQWNPYDYRFDISNVAAHGSTLNCVIPNVSRWYDGTVDGNIEISTDPTAKTMQIRLVSKYDNGFVYAFSGTFTSIIQSGRELFLVGSASNLNSTSALITSAEGYDGKTAIPKGVTKTLTITNVPTWFNFGQPVQGVVYNSKSANCQ